jgi:hypothetical protein
MTVRHALWAACALIIAAASPAVAQETASPKFVEETASSGIDSVYAGEWQYMVGGGVATFDCDDDGFPDMVLAGGEAPAKFYRNASTRGGPLQFEPQTSGLELEAVTGAYPLDVDSDGLTDVVLLRVGENVVMRGLGGCRFARANEDWGFDGGDAWSTAFAATWEKDAVWPTVAIGNYIDRTKDLEPWGSCTDNWLHRPASPVARRFVAPLPLKPSYCALSMLFTDWNLSGTPSLRISNDREYYKGGQEQLWRILPGEAPAPYAVADGWKPLKVWGMGIASADVNGDLYPDYFLTSMADNKLQTLTHPAAGAVTRPDFKDVAFKLKAIAQRPYTGSDVRPSTAWHAQFEDVDNDCLMDLFVAKGNVSEMPDFAAEDPNNLMMQNPDGTFREVGEQAGVASMAVARGAALADFNLDGLLDLVVVNRNSPAQIWRNVTANANHWLALRLEQPATNRDAIGAAVEIRIGATVQRREVVIGGGHASGRNGWWHFGLGPATEAEIRVVWPDGTASAWATVGGDGFYVVERDQPPRPWIAG